MVVRKIPRNYRNITGRVARHTGETSADENNTNEGSAAFESSLERDLYILLDFDLNIKRFEEQPVRIPFTSSDGRERTYTPDVLIFYRTDVLPGCEMPPVLAEVKYRKDLFADWKILKPKFKAARRFARELGWRFAILTEVEIRTPLLDNARFLRGYRKVEDSLDTAHLLLETLYELRVTTPNALTHACFKDPHNRAALIPVLWHLVAQGRIGCDLHLPLAMETPIWTTDTLPTYYFGK